MKTHFLLAAIAAIMLSIFANPVTGQNTTAGTRVVVIDIAVVMENNNSIPISLFLSLAPKQLTNSKLPVLLKVLDPKPVKSLGNLYLEVHEEKEEVYNHHLSDFQKQLVGSSGRCMPIVI